MFAEEKKDQMEQTSKELKTDNEDIEEEFHEISVSEQIRRLQEEINRSISKQVEHKTWRKLSARDVRQNNTKTQNDEKEAVKSKFVGDCTANSISNSDKTVKEVSKKGFPKRVSYAENEVTVFTFTEEAPESLCSIPEVDLKRCSTRQQVPENDTPTVTPPINIEFDHKAPVNQSTIANEDKDCNENIPVLPSVKKLVSKFQILKTSEDEHQSTKKVLDINDIKKKG